jgi:potassium-transporting ATPase KdpC subunit
MRNVLREAIVIFVLFTVITGILYPLAVFGIAQAAFRPQAEGSLISPDGMYTFDLNGTAGSRLIGQPFTNPGYFWSRPSATGPFPYNAAASSGSNLGPINPALANSLKERVEQLHSVPGAGTSSIPVDLVTASGSGLDPDISPAAALYQVPRVASARGFADKQVEDLVLGSIIGRTFGLLGEPRVNVLKLNLALDRMAGGPPH